MPLPRPAALLGLAAVLLGTARAAPTAPEQAFSDLKVYSAGGAPWRVAVEDWDGARKRVASDPAWAKWLAAERKETEAWMARWRDRVSWACGWSHDFVSPKDGSHLTWEPKVPGEDADHFSSPSDPHVAITPKLMGGWVFEFRGRHADMIRRAAQLYRLTGERKYGDWAAAQIDFYADHYLDWKPQRKDQEARLYWQTLDEASYGIMYADAVRLLDPMLDPARKQRWWTRFFQPEAGVLDRGFRQTHNIANWHRCAEAQIALAFHDDALWRKAVYGPFGVKEQLARGVTADYLWYEQSFHYNEFVVEALLTLFTAADLDGKGEELAHEMVIGENLMLAPIYLRFPDGHLPNPADGTGIETAPHLSFLAEASRVFPTTLGLEASKGAHNWQTLLDPPAPSPRPARLPEVVSRNLAASQMAVLKRGPWQIFFHYGQLTSSHAQAEALNFSVFYGPADITHDPGTVGYGSPFHKEYYTQGLNHNVPLIDGEGEKPPQRGLLRIFSMQPAEVAADQRQYRPKVSASRDLKVDGDRLVDTAAIRSQDGAAHVLGLALHLQGRAQLPADFAPDPEFAKGRPPAFGYWHDVARASGKDKASFLVNFADGVVLRVTLAVPGPFTIWHGSTPDVPPKRREGFYIETRGPDATFTTTFEPVKR